MAIAFRVSSTAAALAPGLVLVTFILEYRTAFFKYIKAGVTPEEVLVSARRDMEPVLAKTRFAKETHRQAAEDMLSFRGHLP